MKIISTTDNGWVGRVLIPVMAAILLSVTFFVAEATLGVQEEIYLEDSCCLSYVANSNLHRDSLPAAANTIGWGLSWRRGSTEPVTDPGAAEMLEKYGGVYRGNQDEQVMYFTFDLGYEAGYTSKILDILKDKDAKAIFFLLENYVKRNPELVQRMIDEGHYIGNHSMNHKSLPSLDGASFNAEVDGFNTMMQEKYGITPVFFRPPCGEYNEGVLSTLQQKGYTTVFWSFAYKDWDKNESRGADYAYNKIVSKLHNGMVLLLHSTTADNSDALGSVIDTARSEGFRIGDPVELTKSK